jgi:hydrogenase nickel incorporation protein HypA/HybF
MHEVGLMQQALEIAEEQLRQQGGGRIHRLAFRVGPLSGVEPDALRFAFDVVAQGTCAEGAQIDIEEIPLRCWCSACEREFEPAGFAFLCPSCEGVSDEVRSGREFELFSLEIS